MARRGPVPRGEYSNKSTVLSTRIRQDTRAAMENAAKQSGRSLSQEIEYRLRRSFDEDKGLFEKFGGRRNYAVLRLIADVMQVICNPFRPGSDWLDDPYLFDQLVKALAPVLESFRPPGDPMLSHPDEGMRLAAELQSSTVAANAVLAIRHAPAELPLDPEKNPYPLIRSDLGSVVAERANDRPGLRVATGDASELRRIAAEMEKEEKGE